MFPSTVQMIYHSFNHIWAYITLFMLNCPKNTQPAGKKNETPSYRKTKTEKKTNKQTKAFTAFIIIIS